MGCLHKELRKNLGVKEGEGICLNGTHFRELTVSTCALFQLSQTHTHTHTNMHMYLYIPYKLNYTDKHFTDTVTHSTLQ